MNKTKTLVESWLAAERAVGRTKTQATRALSEACGTDYGLNRVGEWENDIRPVPAKARRHMLRCALPLVLESEGIDIGRLGSAALRRIADRLS